MIDTLNFILNILCVIGIYGMIKQHIKLRSRVRDLRKKLQNLHVESRTSYKQSQAYLDLQNLLNIKTGFPPLRGWAASPDFLLTVSKHTLSHKPNHVIECSSGASTLAIAKCLQMNGKGHVYSLEHDEYYAEITRNNLEEAGLSQWATVVSAPLITLKELPEHKWYSLCNLPNELDDAELLLIDGPPRNTCNMARYPALKLLEPYLHQSFTLFLDDSYRTQEQSIIEKWKADDPLIKVESIPLEKGCARITKSKECLEKRDVA